MKVYGYLTTEYPLASDILGNFIERDAHIVLAEGKESKIKVKVRPIKLYSKSPDNKVYVYEIDSVKIEGLEKAIEDILTLIPATLIRIYWQNSTLLLFAISNKTYALKL
jgi:hypothetical protein